MYTYKNFKTKKQLKEAVAAWNAQVAAGEPAPMTVGAVLAMRVRRVEPVRIFQPNDMFGSAKAQIDYTGTATVEGPHFPEPYRWYAEVTLENGIVVKVK